MLEYITYRKLIRKFLEDERAINRIFSTKNRANAHFIVDFFDIYVTNPPNSLSPSC